ncbi:MAG: type I restriction enzyme HsdR N-terminal domain-containing protein [Syntrophales bacterium]|nr:type I restriction enzyme HsdR N-terminal domain-containing protein [Syntrophales bacterium]
MPIKDFIERAQSLLRQGAFISEAAVSQGILLPALHELGWPVFDTSVVSPEYSVEGRRVDYALCHPSNRPAVFVEVKKTGFSEGADRQLFEYAFHIGVPMAILTDGQEWSFYLPGEQGRYDERRVYKLDLLERSSEEASARLTRYLAYDQLCSGEALIAARSDYQNVARDREIEVTFPKAWHSLLEEQDSLLLDLLAEKVESLCGYKPDPDACSQFLKTRAGHAGSGETGSVKPVLPPVQSNDRRPGIGSQNVQIRTDDRFSFVFKGKSYKARSAREVMTMIFQLLAGEDTGFLERFAARKHGKKRRYLAKDKRELYPGRPDLAEQHSVEVVSGWWLGTNYSHRNIQEIIDLAIEVAGPQLGSAIQANVD